MKRCTSFWGLVSAYWISDRWREAWGLTVVVLAITLLISKAAVWTATASADFIASLAEFHRPETVDPARVILLSALAYFGISFSRSAGLAFRHLVSTTLHRKARRWLVARFDAEILSDQRIALDLMSDRGADGKDARLPDSIDQRLDTCTDHLYGGLIGLVMGFIGAVASMWFVSVALISRSQPVEAARPGGGGGEPDPRLAPRPGARRPDRPRAGRLRHRAPRRRPRGALRADRHALRLARRPRRPAPHPRAAEERRRLARRARHRC